MTDEKARRPSSLRFEGVAKVLDDLQANVTERVAERLRERVHRGMLDAPEAEINSIAAIAGFEARKAAGNAIGEAHQLGVNSSARREDYERDTLRIEKKPG